MAKKFLLYGVAAGYNYGCDAIIIGTRRILRGAFPNCEDMLPASTIRERDFSMFLGDECKDIVRHGWMEVRLGLLWRRLQKDLGMDPGVLHTPWRLVREADCVLSIGGDIYTFANKEKDWPFPYPMVEQGDAIMKSGKPYVIWCASVGPLEQAGDRLPEMVNHLKSCAAIIVREHDSYNYLRDTLGLTENVHLAGDPAFVMEPVAFDCPFVEPRDGEKLLAVNFSMGPMKHVFGDMSADEMRAQLAELTREILNQLPIRIMFVPHLLAEGAFLRPLAAALEKEYPGRIHILEDGLGAQRSKWAVSQSNALLTMRFHCSLAGFSSVTPTIILVSTKKGAKICREMYGDLEYAINIEDMNAPTVIERVQHILDNEQAVRDKLNPEVEKMRERTMSAGTILADVLNKSR